MLHLIQLITLIHILILTRLEQCVGIRGLALSWFKSFLCDITFSVGIGNSVSSVATLTCGVPQGSILAPTLFSLYMLPLGNIPRKHGVSFHFYADDIQTYLPLKQKKHERTIGKLFACPEDIIPWLTSHFFMLKFWQNRSYCVWASS